MNESGALNAWLLAALALLAAVLLLAARFAPRAVAVAPVRTVEPLCALRRGVRMVPNQAVAFARARDRAAGVPAGAPGHLYAMREGRMVALAVRLGASDQANTEVVALERIMSHEQIVLEEAR